MKITKLIDKMNNLIYGHIFYWIHVSDESPNIVALFFKY